MRTLRGSRTVLATPGSSGAAARPGGPPVILGLLPFAVMAVVAAVDLLAGPGVGFLPLLCLGPALAAISRSAAATAAIGGAALGVCLLLAVYDGLLGSRRLVIALATICGVTMACVLASAARHRRERELADVLAVAEVAQRVLLRPVPGEVGPVRFAVRYVSAAASARIGGDLYEVAAAGGVVRLAIGDVQGKGLAAVQTAAAVLGTFRAAVHDAPGLAQISEQIEADLQRQGADEEFVTAILAQIAADGSSVEVMNCGHPPPLLLSGTTAQFIEPAHASLPLGLAHLASSRRAVTTVAFGPGDQILFYTDGISEARDKSGNFYPLERSAALFAGKDPETALDRLREDVIRHTGHPLDDDAAMLLVSHAPDRPRRPGDGNLEVTAAQPGPSARSAEDVTQAAAAARTPHQLRPVQRSSGPESVPG